MTDIWLIHSTFATRDEALSVARALVEARLAACVHVREGVSSVYRWEGEMREEPEVLLEAKTQQKTLQKAMEMVKNLHSYTLPCILALPVDGGFPPYMEWVKRETA
jgi:periplasmic divalent cation tolerance protein